MFRYFWQKGLVFNKMKGSKKYFFCRDPENSGAASGGTNSLPPCGMNTNTPFHHLSPDRVFP